MSLLFKPMCSAVEFLLLKNDRMNYPPEQKVESNNTHDCEMT